jgi:hypothetical protein
MNNKDRLVEFFKAAKTDEQRMLSFIADNAKYIAIKEELNEQCFLYGTYVGHEGFKQLFANLTKAFETQKLSIKKS